MDKDLKCGLCKRPVSHESELIDQGFTDIEPSADFKLCEVCNNVLIKAVADTTDNEEDEVVLEKEGHKLFMSETETEKEPENYKVHKQITDWLHETYKAKNKDYGNSFTETYEELGHVAPYLRVTDKYKRIRNLVHNGIDNIEVKDEKMLDTILDMSNYLIMWAMEIMEEEQN